MTLQDLYAKFRTDISKHVQKGQKTYRWLGALLTLPFEYFCPPEVQKLPNHDENQQGSRFLLYKCVYKTWDLYMIFKAMNADKWLWYIFGCKVVQNVPIWMKLKLDVCHHLLNLYIQFQTDISKHADKMPGKHSCDAIQTRCVVPPTECIYQVSNWFPKACWKSTENPDGRKDRHSHGIIRLFFKRAYKKPTWIRLTCTEYMPTVTNCTNTNKLLVFT